MKRIKDYIKPGNYVVCLPDSTVEEAVKLYAEKKLGYTLVWEKTNGPIIGIFTENDLGNRVVAQGKDVKTTKIREVMTPNPVAVDWNTDVDSCMFMMLRNNFRHILIRDNDGKIYSVASVRDVLKAKVEEVNEMQEASNIFEANRFIDRDSDVITESINEYRAK